MQLTSYVQTIHDLSVFVDAGMGEAIISNKDISRFGKLNLDETNDLLKRAKDLNLKTILEWDVLAVESDFAKIVDFFKEINLHLVDSIRVQDTGFLEYVIERTNKKIQFISETGNHNFTGLKAWEAYIGDRLERIILSPELSKGKLELYGEKLSTDLEILALGRILLFYTPRMLLNHLLPEDAENMKKQIHSDHFIEAIGESEESPHKGFPIIENRHGTFMFHMKHLLLLENIIDLKNAGIKYIRCDLRFGEDSSQLKSISKIIIDPSLGAQFKKNYKIDTIRGYFDVNKSDVLFKKLKNSRLQRKDSSYVGEVLEVIKGEFMAVHLKGNLSLKMDDELKYITPEGKEVYCKIHSLQDISLNDVSQITTDKIALINYMGGIWVKSQVYLN